MVIIIVIEGLCWAIVIDVMTVGGDVPLAHLTRKQTIVVKTSEAVVVKSCLTKTYLIMKIFY